MNDSKNQKISIERRLNILEAQQSVMAGFVSVLLQNTMMQFPENARNEIIGIYEHLFEHSISGLLASEAGFPDVSVEAVETMKKQMLGPLRPKDQE